MLSPLRHLARRLLRLSPPKPEVSRLIVGSTGSGKSEGELVDLVRLAGRNDCAVVLLDGHGPLAFRTVGEWAARRHEHRIVYETIHDTSRVLGWNLLPASLAHTPAAERLDRAETRDDLVQCFIAPRNLGTLADRPLTPRVAGSGHLARPLSARPRTVLGAAVRLSSRLVRVQTAALGVY